ncbi:MAG: cytochrome C [Gammaproteobacteria bacterium RBG_16_51_14]|nr:MAG: cytochrome C [Gammaproteobacteria bacterium RBG_16_51_14]
MWKKYYRSATLTVFASVFIAAPPVFADEFTDADLKKWQAEFQSVVAEGEKLFHSHLGSNAVGCDQCHPNGSDTHPETYPKFQKQLSKVATLRDMINWCIENPAEGEPLALDDPKMIAIEAYLTWERRGEKLDPGKH